MYPYLSQKNKNSRISDYLIGDIPKFRRQDRCYQYD